MRIGFELSLNELTGEELRVLLRKHTKEFNVSIISSVPYQDSLVGYVKGETAHVINMLDMLASNGYSVRLISAK